MATRRTFIPGPALRLAAAQAAVAIAALVVSPSAWFAALAASTLALLRYRAMAGFAASLGKDTARAALFAGAWVLAFAALAFALAASARFGRHALPWAVAAALAGPLERSVEAAIQGMRRLGSEGSLSGAARGEGAS